jgi:hypothetical protein
LDNGANTYFANGFLVHNKATPTPGPSGTPGPTRGPPSCDSVGRPAGNPTIYFSQKTYDVYVDKVKNINDVAFLVYATSNTANKHWYTATNLGGGTWRATIELARDYPSYDDSGQFSGSLAK